MKIGNVECYGVIYKITNIINGKCYIGQTTRSFKKRYKTDGKGIERVYKYHKNRKNNNHSYNEYLLKSIKKYGFEAFEVIEVFDVAFSKEELNIKEIHYIELFNCFSNGYNFTKGGEGALGNQPMLGKHHTDDAKKKISENHAFKGKKRPTHSKKMKGKNNPKATSVICITTGRVFNTATEGTRYYAINQTGVVDCCKGRQKSAGKLSDGTKLVWRYITIIEL